MTNIIENYSRDNPGKVWRTYTYDMDNGADIAKYVARTRYAFPGGYELFAITTDGAVLCHKCCRAEFRLIAESVRDYPGDVFEYCDGWRVVEVGSTAEYDNFGDDDNHLICDHCNRIID